MVQDRQDQVGVHIGFPRKSRGYVATRLDSAQAVIVNMLSATTGQRSRLRQIAVLVMSCPMAQLKRDLHLMPNHIRARLETERLTQAYAARPAYQRNDYLGWIAMAKRPQTQAKRLQQMIDELKRGDVYMNMAWRC
jgi:hypothetical protein